MYIAYQEWNPRPATLNLVDQAEAIINEYMNDGYILTLRQLYYQFVARGIIENSDRNYNNLGNAITKARMAGMISWTAIEDRNREHKSYWYDEDEINPIKDLPSYIRFDQWARQECYVEVWVEKEALGNVISKACSPYLVPHLSCKGYLSASEAWRAGRRFGSKLDEGKKCFLVHLGDHDPSGIDMTRDNRNRMDLFTEIPGGVEVNRIALNMDQVRAYSPPPNPAKLKDPRSKGYIRKFGDISWELDALEPQVLVELIQSEISKYIDHDTWEEVREEQEQKRQLLRNIYEHWNEIKPIIEGN